MRPPAMAASQRDLLASGQLRQRIPCPPHRTRHPPAPTVRAASKHPKRPRHDRRAAQHKRPDNRPVHPIVKPLIPLRWHPPRRQPHKGRINAVTDPRRIIAIAKKRPDHIGKNRIHPRIVRRRIPRAQGNEHGPIISCDQKQNPVVAPRVAHTPMVEQRGRKPRHIPGPPMVANPRHGHHGKLNPGLRPIGFQTRRQSCLRRRRQQVRIIVHIRRPRGRKIDRPGRDRRQKNNRK